MAFDPSREGQLTEDKLKWGYWWVTHKVQVRKVFSVVMIVVDISLVGFAGYGFIDWFFGSGVQERAQIALLTKNLTDYASLRKAQAPKQFIIDQPIALSSDGAFDIVSRMTNPNLNWWAEFDFKFAPSDMPLQHEYILPGETKYIRALSVKTQGGSTLSLEKLSWHRVDGHVIVPDYRTWAGSRLNFIISGIDFKKPLATDVLPVSRASFTVKNDTAYSYYTVGFFVTLFSGSQVVGVNAIKISDLRSGEERKVESSWFNLLPEVTRVEVSPEVNIFDDRVYVTPGR